MENIIEGAVITFVDITEMKRVQQALLEANALRRLAVVLRDAHDAITVQDMEGCILAWNPGAERMYGWSDVEALAMNTRDRIPASRRAKNWPSSSDLAGPTFWSRIAHSGSPKTAGSSGCG